MDQKKILQADYLDIIFDNRNKAYGGYELRKTYNRRVKKGVGFLMLGVSAIASFSFIGADKRLNVVAPKPIITIIVDVLPPVPPPPKNITPPPPPPPAPPTKTAIFTPPKIVENEEVKPDNSMTEVSKLHDVNVGLHTVDTGSAESIMPSGDGDRRVAVVTEPPKTSIPVFVEQMPEFRGMQEYLANHINYPAAAREANIQGRVAITFIINEDGSISDAKVTRGIGGGCDEEALRVIRAMPKWKPGRQNGAALKVMFTQAITFKLE